MKLKSFVFNPVEENTYLIYDETGECVIIDAGCFYPEEKAELQNFISDKKLTVKYLINTHLHFDHCFGANFVKQTYKVDLYAHSGDEELLKRLPEQAARFGFRITEQSPTIDHYIQENDEIRFGNQTLKAIHVPGHSPGSIVFYNQEQACLFVGDVLFQRSVGRTDLPGGDFELLKHGIQTKLYTLPDETRVFSGHGPDTNIGFEKRNNHYIKGE
ncbi:MAG: MBL fold metallo-hydrolase [Bacteroidales bacterium]|nr:MBL fold metallo-hydrolase [Bacteroidales bacterium]